jgi:hypothetical protein
MSAKWALASLAIIAAVALTAPASAAGWHHYHHHHYYHRGGWGLDVAPGGGHYTPRDVALASPRRMSHPFVGEPCAPSAVVRGPHLYVERVENRMTAALNLRQLHRRW